MKVVIVGGGVMGMMQARELSHKGIDVVLVDKGLCGTEASWAGGGIVSPLYPWRYSDPITALSEWSQAYYPNLIQCLEAESDIDPELTRHGMLMLAVSGQEEALSWCGTRHPSWIEKIDAQQLYQLEPELRAGCDGALWMPHIASVRNPRLLQALRVVLDREPRVTVLEESGLESLLKKGDKVLGITTVRGEQVLGDAVVLCTGAWTQGLLGEESMGIEPVKGQMVLFEAKPGIVNRVVLNGGRYVIPRRDGRVVAGSTLEYQGFDKTTTQSAHDELSDMAIDMFPALADFPVGHHWAGLRPGSPSGLPYIGKLPNSDNLYVNAGHFRNGLVLAPASVRLMTSILTESELPIDPRPYDPCLRLA